MAKREIQTDCVAFLERAATRAPQAAADELASAMGMGNTAVLERAIAKAQQHGVDTAKASERVAELRAEEELKRAKQQAADELTSAMGMGKTAVLEQAIAKAQQHGVDTTRARTRLAELKREQQAVRPWVGASVIVDLVCFVVVSFEGRAFHPIRLYVHALNPPPPTTTPALPTTTHTRLLTIYTHLYINLYTRIT